MLKLAKDNLSKINFGFQEKYEESITNLFKPLNFTPKMVKTNIAPKSQPKIKLTMEQYDILCDRNKYDIELYKYARELYRGKYGIQ